MPRWVCERATWQGTRSEGRAVRTEDDEDEIDSYGGVADVHLPLANIRWESRCWCLLQNLLVAPLDRAVPLSQMHRVAVVVAKDLKLDVARTLHEALKEDSIVAKSLESFALARVEGVQKVRWPLHKTHTFATASQRGLDHHRVFDALRFGLQSLGVLRLPEDRRVRGTGARSLSRLFRRGKEGCVRARAFTALIPTHAHTHLDVSVVAGSDRDVSIDHNGFGRALGPHRLDSGYRGADERHIIRSTRRGEVLVFRQEAIAWRHRE